MRAGLSLRRHVPDMLVRSELLILISVEAGAVTQIRSLGDSRQPEVLESSAALPDGLRAVQ